jgi:hypothetical protein
MRNADIPKVFDLVVSLIDVQDALIKAKNELLVCYRTMKDPSRRLFNDLQRHTDKIKQIKRTLEEYDRQA